MSGAGEGGGPSADLDNVDEVRGANGPRLPNVDHHVEVMASQRVRFDNASVDIKYTGDNFSPYKEQIMIVFEARFAQWLLSERKVGDATYNSQAIRYLRMSLDDDYKYLVDDDCRNCHDAWASITTFHQSWLTMNMSQLRTAVYKLEMLPVETVKQYITRVRKVSTEFKMAGGHINEADLTDIAVHGVMHRPEFMAILTSHVTPGQGIRHTSLQTLSSAMHPIEHAQTLSANFAGLAVGAKAGRGSRGPRGRGGRGGRGGCGSTNNKDAKDHNNSGRGGGRGRGRGQDKRHCLVCGKLGHVAYQCRMRAAPLDQYEAPADENSRTETAQQSQGGTAIIIVQCTLIS